MLKPLLLLPALLLWIPSPWQSPPATPPSAPSIPAEAIHQPNPVKPTPASQAHAKQIYGYDCAMCHGQDGDGKSDMATSMNLKLLDYTNPAALANMTDGELFYIIKNGKDPMPPEAGRASTDDIWNLVLYLRSLAKK